MGPSSVDLNLLLKGKPVTIYLVLPIERIVSHSMVMSMWIELICQTLLRRTRPPQLPTILFVDECAQVGFASAALKMIAVYMRGQGVKLWSFFQDFSQIKNMFANDQSTFVNSNSAITLLPGTGMAAQELAATLAVPQQQVENLAESENQGVIQSINRAGREARPSNRKDSHMTHETIVRDGIHAAIGILHQLLFTATLDSSEANGYMANGDRNTAIGTLLRIEPSLQQALALYRAVIAMHRYKL